MPFHPKMEFALNRIGILGDMASDEMKILFQEDFEDLLKISMDSISDPKKFKKFLKKERMNELNKKRQIIEDGEQRELISLNIKDLENEEDSDSDNQEEDENQNNNDDEDQTSSSSSSRIEKESKRIRNELKQMSLILLDSLRLGIQIHDNKNQNQDQEETEEEPDVSLSNIPLIRFVLTILSDSVVANTLRIPLLQGDLPLLARAIFRCLVHQTVNNNNKSSSASSSPMRNHLIFLLLDAIATMCADSAACRLSFSCCIPQIAQILKSFVVVVTPSQQQQNNNNSNKAFALSSGSAFSNKNPATTSPSTSSSSNVVVQKKPIQFVRPSTNNNNSENVQNQQQENNNTNSNINNINSSSTSTNQQQVDPSLPTTNEDDVIFAGAAALETMLFHCSESVESLVLDNEGIKILVALFKQGSKKNSSTSKQQSSATDTVAFLKRTLMHIRTCGAIPEEKWNGEIFSANNLQKIFGRQGDDLAVDELKWNLTGGIKAFMRK